MRAILHRAVIVLSLLLSTTSAASAAPITFEFTVQVTALGGSAATLFPTLSVGETITGRYVSDTSIQDGSGATNFGAYEYLPPAGSPFATWVDIEGQRISWTGSRIAVTDTSVFDVYLFESSGAVSLIPGVSTAKFAGQLNGGGGSQIVGDLFPVTAPNVGAFGFKGFTLHLGPDSGPDRITGVVTSISTTPSTPVPEPASLLLLATAVPLVVRRLRRRGQTQV